MHKLIHVTLAFCCSVFTAYTSLVTIAPNNQSQIVVPEEEVGLSFEYLNNHSRPVSEFNAVVTRLDSANSVVAIQKCTEKRKYEPGNYRVVINTFPVDVRNVDFDHGEKVIVILQPGYVNFPETEGVDYVTIYEQKGEKYVAVQKFSMADPALRHLQIQPGRYQAHFHKTDRSKGVVEKVVNFRIRPNEEKVVKVK